MGSFYTSITARGPDQQQLLEWLDRPAYVSVTENGITTIFDEACESQDLDELSELAGQISAQFGCPVLSLMNHDDSVLVLELHEDGISTDRYISNPDYFSDEEGAGGPQGGNAARLAAAFDMPEAPVQEALTSDDYVFAVDRHRALAAALGLPPYSIGVGYNYLSAGEFAPGAGEENYRHTEE